MWRRFVSWLRRVFSSKDEHPDEETPPEDTPKNNEKIDVSSCEVVSIVFEDEEDREEKAEEPFDFDVDGI